MGGVCFHGAGGGGGGGGNTGGVSYQETRVYLVCSLMAGKGEPQLLEACGTRACAELEV